ncbi:uncharacterized protein EI90DRAFT_2536835 [Cantharellus anzutake]|uniref:uncharacterized protein n=1 Tax=Cantharellus anzutake TaxID=1750568 RepID=UPI001905EF7D|nr:uncharacterized protein EI90DRAFT_2536835 [Cantharellus anzutake]KAF8338065.1 hypothetical protein EI90DRAFT_2536835 [Cantharellus anzutake]
MADPVSSSRHRASTSSSRHGRTISSTTLLLILSLVLAVLAVLLSLPSRQPAPFVAPPPAASPTELAGGKRAKELATRESEVAHREFEVARREAELLGGSPGGITIPTCSACPAPSTAIVTVTAHVLETSIVQQLPVTATVTSTVTQVQEVVREVESVAIGAGPDQRVEDLHIREHRVSEREKDVGHREELVGRREIDVSRRENWVMEQLV